MSIAAVERGKLDIGRVIQGTFQVLGRNFATFSVLGLVFYGLVSYRAWLSSSDVVRVRGGDYACDLSGVGSTSACEQAGGVTTTIGTNGAGER